MLCCEFFYFKLSEPLCLLRVLCAIGFIYTLLKMPQSSSCFSRQNFEKVHAYITSHTDSAGHSSVTIEGYAVTIIDADRLAFKKDNYTFGQVHKQKGIIALTKRQQDLERHVRAIEQAFCALVEAVSG
jgi:hypothetical protein